MIRSIRNGCFAGKRALMVLYANKKRNAAADGTPSQYIVDSFNAITKISGITNSNTVSITFFIPLPS